MRKRARISRGVNLSLVFCPSLNGFGYRPLFPMELFLYRHIAICINYYVIHNTNSNICISQKVPQEMEVIKYGH